jgi:hypothetical protein
VIQKTTDYDMFKFRADNRAAINQGHVNKLVESIKINNLLEYTPILVNDEMEIIDGQHRLLAAKKLGTEIYYKQEKGINASDVIALNLAQKWGMQDYMNYYCKNHYPEYMKLDEYMKKNGVSFRVALNLVLGSTHDSLHKFRMGKYKHSEEALEGDIDMCWHTINYIRKMNGNSPYTTTTKFWAALLMLVRHSNFDAKKWQENLKRMVDKFTVKINKKSYLDLMMEVHNWRNPNKVELAE